MPEAPVVAPATQSQQPAPAAAPAAPEPASQPTGLEKVYADFKIEDAAEQFQPQTQQAPAQQQAPQAPAPTFKVPDPFDPGFPEYQARVAGTMQVLAQQLAETQGKIGAYERNLQVKQTNDDIRQAVGIITEKAGIEPEIAEVALEAKARKDPKFLSVWNNRAKNPKAFQAALQAVASEFQQKYTVRQDPQLVENQRAAAASRNQMATTSKDDANADWTAMSPGERQHKIQSLLRAGGR